MLLICILAQHGAIEIQCLAVLFLLLKTGYWPSYCQISTDLDNILHTPIVVWNTLVGRLKTAIGTRAAPGRARTTYNFFCNTCNAP